MNRKWMAIVTLLVLMLSVCVFALAEQTDGAPTATPGLGLITPKPAGTPKPTKTPKPTASPEPVPTFTPGILEKHEGHDVRIIELEKLEYTHRVREYCNDCKVTIRTYWEDHQLDAEGHCLKCSYRCKHDRTYVREVPADGGEKTWDGNWISYPGTEITVCYRCNKYLKYENTVIRKFHNRHTRFLPEQECLPHDADTHALVRICEDCGTEVTKYVPHNCPPSDKPYKDDGDSDTHSRLVRCDDCGFWVPQQQPHTWVHDSYRKDDTDGGEEGHIEVMKCTVCGAKKAVWQPHGAGTHVVYRQSGNDKTHIEVLQCPVCNETFEKERPHELEHAFCRNDGDTNTHIEVLVCTVCEAETEKREAHRPVHISWKSVSDSQDQEVVRCNMCGLTYTCAPVAHTFNTYAYESEGVQSHRKYAACSKCGTRNGKGVREPHARRWKDVPWDCCKNCGEIYGHSHVLATTYIKEYRSVDENSHAKIVECKYCYADCFEGIYAHTFDPVTMKCTLCGYLKEGCEHQYTYKPSGIGIQEEQHTLIGTCSGCGKQITVTEAHDMQFASATDFKPDGDNHTRSVTERCSVCGCEKQHTESEGHDMQIVEIFEYHPVDEGSHEYSCSIKCSVCGCEKQHTESEGHDMQIIEIFEYQPVDETLHSYSFSEKCSLCGAEGTDVHNESHTFSYSYESVNAQEHRQTCTKCNGYGPTTKHQFAWSADGSIHICELCGEKGEHNYILIECSDKRGSGFHHSVYVCEGCGYRIAKDEEHTIVVNYRQQDENEHEVKTTCELCDFRHYDVKTHDFGESGVCACGYHRGDPVSETSLPGESLPGNIGDIIAALPAFCHMTADGNEMVFGYAFGPSEDGDAVDLLLLPESISGDAVIEIRFTAPELEFLQSLGIKSVYIRLGENDLLLPGDIWQISEALFGQDTGELLITLTPGSDGAYTVQYNPAGVYITE